jgi:hypothetical protein
MYRAALTIIVVIVVLVLVIIVVIVIILLTLFEASEQSCDGCSLRAVAATGTLLAAASTYWQEGIRGWY